MKFVCENVVHIYIGNWELIHGPHRSTVIQSLLTLSRDLRSAAIQHYLPAAEALVVPGAAVHWWNRQSSELWDLINLNCFSIYWHRKSWFFFHKKLPLIDLPLFSITWQQLQSCELQAGATSSIWLGRSTFSSYCVRLWERSFESIQRHD